jgi:hypothetical protein
MIGMDFDVRPLGCAVIHRAIRDARCRDPIKALDAVLFLTSPDACVWLEALGFDVDPLAFVTSGQVRRVPKGLLYARQRTRSVRRAQPG